ncbi:MAG: hypothetical protein HYY65_02945 [Candidatus Tectomicrobia bacterium]|uniref:Uncharacterized protein n=1 Tax=Tectimicrobiota bacterium TaxID=2528274 RepID=A0A932GNJ6_UNCTE|nr:hypothetical protein [Candidatus Tectomicrobia bacterium]
MVRAVDLKQIFLNTPISEKLQHVQQQQEDVNKRHFVLQFQEEARQKEKKAQSAGHLQEEIRTRDKPADKRQQKKKKRSERLEPGLEPEETKQPPEKSEGQWIDVVA